MPQLCQRTFRSDSGSDHSSNGGRNSGNGSRVWGNSILSANFETPVDNEDENEIRRLAASNSLKNFLQVNNLVVFQTIVDRYKDLTLEQLKAYSEAEIRHFCQMNATADVTSAKIE